MKKLSPTVELVAGASQSGTVASSTIGRASLAQLGVVGPDSMDWSRQSELREFIEIEQLHYP